MDPVVLVLAGVFLVGGVALLLISLLVRRAKRGHEVQPAIALAAGALRDQPAGVFVNPLPAVAQAAPLVAAVAEASEPPATQESATQATVREMAASGVESSGYSLTVQLGFRLLRSELYQDAVQQFEKAVALADDPGVKLKLYVEIGNSHRRQGRYGSAEAAYLQAIELTVSDLLRGHLERSIDEMAELDRSEATSA